MAVSLWIVVLQFHIKQFVTRVGRQRLHVHFLPETTCVSMLRQLLSTKTGFLASLNVILAETLITLQQRMPQREWVGKSPPRKRATNTASCTPHLSEDRNQWSDHLCVEQVDPTKIVNRRSDRPDDPPITSHLVVKRIAGGIRKCAGCSKDIKSVVIGFNQDEDSQYCLARHEAYYFWNKNASCFKLTSGSRHYNLNPVCTKSHSSLVKKISKGGIDTPESLLDLRKERFHDVDIID